MYICTLYNCAWTHGTLYCQARTPYGVNVLMIKKYFHVMYVSGVLTYRRPSKNNFLFLCVCMMWTRCTALKHEQIMAPLSVTIGTSNINFSVLHDIPCENCANNYFV